MNKGPAFKVTLIETRMLERTVVITQAVNTEDALRKARAGLIDNVVSEEMLSIKRKPLRVEEYERAYA